MRRPRYSSKKTVKRHVARRGRVRRAVKFKHRLKYSPKVREIALASGALPKYADGGYPMFYLVTDENGKNLDVACPKCASGKGHLGDGDKVTDYDVNWEDPEMYCGACNERIESAYAEDKQPSASRVGYEETCSCGSKFGIGTVTAKVCEECEENTSVRTFNLKEERKKLSTEAKDLRVRARTESDEDRRDLIKQALEIEATIAKLTPPRRRRK